MFVANKMFLGAIAGALLSSTPLFACTDRAAAEAAIAASDFETAQALHGRVAVDPECDDAFRLWLDEALARHFFADGLQALSAEEKRSSIETSIQFFPHWRSYTALADLAAADGNHAEEARHLQAALNQMNDGPEHHGFTEAEAQDVLDRAATAMLLSDEVVAPPRTRSGAPGGVFIESLRGFAVQEVVLAIEYDFDSAQMTAKGKEYADQLLSYLLERRPDAIALEGHTDPVGADSYNLALSLQRAEALRAYLLDAGFGGEITVTGKGETDVPAAPPGITPDSLEHHQIARRVVLVRG
ncbi:MAG: OmpA family protein [Roseobacter sp.]|jgi:outer membrane protein OmpA-like peptidoglycan-associated protein|nr:OmpA family protein [Roseobacter sp.]